MKSDPEDDKSEHYFHYFIGGIRGLGTWGVGHLVDHCTGQLARWANRSNDECDDIQLLLEVTYKHYHITDVRDVSNEDEAYFRERCSSPYVTSAIKQHQHPGP